MNKHPLIYGSDEGALWVREEVAKLNIKVFPESGTKAEHLNLTGGASYGIMNILAQTTLPHTGYTKQAFVITPTYYLINDSFIDAGFSGKVTAIDEKPGTIDFAQLEERLEYFTNQDRKDHSADLHIVNRPGDIRKKTYTFVLYCIPSHSNPGGQVYDLETRLRLIDLARKYDMLIITDDVYDLLIYTKPLDVIPTPLPRLTHLDRLTAENEYGNTISNSTFSKLIAPGLRFGYQESVSRMLVYQLSQGGANVSGGTPSQLNSMIVGTIIKDGLLDDVINNFRKVYSGRAELLRELIQEHLPRGTTATGFEGGYFIWVTLPENVDSRRVVQKLEERGVILAGGDKFEVLGDTRDWGARCVRLSVSYLTVEEIRQAMQLWGAAIKKVGAATPQPASSPSPPPH